MIKKIKFNFIHFLRYFYLIKFNKFEIEIEILKSLVNQNSNCFDIGCCHGSYSRILAKYSKKVYAFEAEKENYAYLRTVMRQKNFHVFNYGVSNKNGVSNLYIPVINSKKNTAMSSLLNNTQNENLSSKRPKILFSQKVKTITLDTFITKKKIKSVDFIKIDVEGMELQILKKSKSVLKIFKPIFMIEILRDDKNNHKKVFNFMKKYNYLSFYLNRKNKKLFKCSAKDVAKFQTKKLKLLKDKNFFDQQYIHNFFFIPKDKIKSSKFF